MIIPDSVHATSLTEVKKLTASDAEAGDFFGYGVALSGDTIIVGAYQGAAPAAASATGAAYVYERNQGGANNWGEVKRLTSSDADALDFFGFSVALSGDIAVVGAPEEGAMQQAGAAYVFQRNQGGADNWGK